jgi:hypothetical protein
MRRVSVDWNGRQVEGEEVDWEVVRGEDWNIYRLSDGSTIKVKTIVGKIIRLDERLPDGEPVYVVKSQNLVVAQVQPHLMMSS